MITDKIVAVKLRVGHPDGQSPRLVNNILQSEIKRKLEQERGQGQITLQVLRTAIVRKK